MRKLFILATVILFCASISNAQSNISPNPSGSSGGSITPGGAGTIVGGTGGGTAQTQILTPSPAITSLVTGGSVIYCWQPAVSNSGPGATLNISGLGAKTITKGPSGVLALVANDIFLGATACATYDGTEFQLQNPQAGIGALTSTTNYGTAAQALNLYVSNGCTNGPPPSCTGNFEGWLAQPSLAASLQWLMPPLDAPTAYGAMVSDAAQHVFFNPDPARIINADWTCGTGGTNTSCTTAQTISTLTFTLPLLARSWTIDCNGVVGQATGATANSWNIQTATNGATNLTASYSMNTAATAMTGGATTDVASTTTTQVIGPTWTLGSTGTKMPFHIWATVEGASASGTVVNIQLVAPTVADLVTIYRGSTCTAY
jgi:hypothetical protein